MNQNVTQYIANAKLWKEELLAIREILLETELIEEFKWASPCYTLNNKNIVILAPFKEYFALGFFMEKPLSYRFAILTDLRLIGDINGENLNTKYALRNSYDISCAIKYLMVDKSYGKISMSAGIGLLNRSTHIESALIDTNSTNQANVVFPVSIYYCKSISKRIDATILYRNYWSFTDDLDAVELNKNNDQYQLIAIGLSYHFGSKNYRFKKQNTCPAQQ